MDSRIHVACVELRDAVVDKLFLSLQEEDLGLALQEWSFIILHTFVCNRDSILNHSK